MNTRSEQRRINVQQGKSVNDGLTTNELKPCPFCGGEGEMIENFLFGKAVGYMVGCKNCWCELRIYTSKQNAVKAWNRRKGDIK